MTRVVTKLDLTHVRRAIADEYRKDLLEEAPNQYKPVQPVIDTVTDAGIGIASGSPATIIDDQGMMTTMTTTTINQISND